MPKARVTFFSAEQNSQDIGMSDQDKDHMFAHVLFNLSIDGEDCGNLCVKVAQPYGSDYETLPIEVGPPLGYNGPWNHAAFSERCDKYFRSQFGSSGMGFCFGPGQHMRGNIVYSEPMMAEFDIPDEGSRAW